jgi:hypothetical protein
MNLHARIQCYDHYFRRFLAIFDNFQLKWAFFLITNFVINFCHNMYSSILRRNYCQILIHVVNGENIITLTPVFRT